MKHICPNCGSKFSAQEALCEDWRNPKRSLGCPNCKVWLKHVDHRAELKRNFWFLLVIAIVITVNALIKELETDWLSYGYAIVIATSIVAFILINYSLNGNSQLVKPKWKQSPLEIVDDDENV